MKKVEDLRTGEAGTSPERLLAQQAFSRVAGAPLIEGNDVRLLKDADQNYPAWLDAIHSAKRTIHFESYIVHADDVGRRFVEALAEKAAQGVKVRVLYDWFGGFPHTWPRFWRPLKKAGGDVRCFNPPRFDEPFGWLSRDHRKMLAVDSRIGFVTGLCVGRRWVGNPERGIEPWRDTGIELRGPAMADLEAAFCQTWSTCGTQIPHEELPGRSDIPHEGAIGLRVVASAPNTTGLYRLDQLIAAEARETLWLTDAYFVGTTTYVQALAAAAKDGVDVRLLVPGGSDIPILRSVSRAGYRSLLEAGVRIFEWNGPMLHAKTAVADSRWARVGSTNLNVASWIGNWELDVAIDDGAFAHQMEEMYLGDLTRATEILLTRSRRVLPIRPRPRRPRYPAGFRGGSAGRMAAGALGIEHAVGAAISNRRTLGPAEAKVMAFSGVLLLILSILAVLWPRVVAIPTSVLAAWIAIALFIRAVKLRRGGRQPRSNEGPAARSPRSPS
jgi:cardiolipin synthase